MRTLPQLKKDLDRLRDPRKAAVLQRFFKTGRGEYGEGDVFLGIVVPEQRKIAKKYKDLSLEDIQKLLNSKVHEYRLVGLLVLVLQYQNAKIKNQKSKLRKFFSFYLKNTKNINNWDLVDLSAPNIVGDFLLDKDRSILYKLALSTDPLPRKFSDKGKRDGPRHSAVRADAKQGSNVWERRIAIMATFTFIKKNEFKDTLKISEMLLRDDHDLIHKAVGWMLREVGKRDQAVEEKFLKKHYKKMPRTMLRYAIEKFPEKKRKWYLKK